MSKNKSHVVTARPRKMSFLQKVVKYRVLLLMCLPAIVFFFAFSYLPMPGAYVAFTSYNYRKGIFGSEFVGWDNFKFLFESGKIWLLTKNTILYNIAFILLGNLLAIFMAILFNEIKKKIFKKTAQTIMFLPYFISDVLVGLLIYNLLNSDFGFVNSIITSLGGKKISFYDNPNIWPGLIVLINLWKSTGYNTVVYFAAICGIDQEIIEAARVDGANGFQKIRHIILPSLKPTFVILLLFAMGGIIRGNFGLFYNIIGSNSMLFKTTDIIETFVYRATVNDFNFQTASAVGLYQSVFGFILVVVCNKIVSKIDPDYSLF
ncbi:ABC transporter permease [Anaerosporobacter faecicola]|uniref:ABC transporter permease n=1 Tax=Anaerosporobacter faecicola TaxID=2718714 RepID=UPI00143BB198|nr:ABC transporter permease subunit [Anaerosporobacter faecicola]